MKVIKGNIWDYWIAGDLIVIPTNGTIKKDGSCVMGRGLALQAKQKIKILPKDLGTAIINLGNKVLIFSESNLITFPVKNNWWEQAQLKLIECSVIQLDFMISEFNKKLWAIEKEIKKIYLPKVGCGNGKLDWKDVEPILDKYLDERFIVVDLK